MNMSKLFQIPPPQCENYQSLILGTEEYELDEYSSHRAEILLTRYCPNDPSNSSMTVKKPTCLEMQIISIGNVSDTISEVELNTDLKKVCNYTYKDSKGNTINAEFDLNKIIASRSLILFSNSESFLWTTFTDFYIMIRESNFDQYQNTSLAMSIFLNLVSTKKIHNLYCNFINLGELGCSLALEPHTVQSKDRNITTSTYEAYEFLTVEGQTFPIQLPTTVYSQDVGQLQDSLNTKNYILYLINNTLWMCRRKQPDNIYLTHLISPDKNVSTCQQVEFDDDNVPIYIKDLLLEENYSNEIDGYILVATCDKSKLESAYRIFKTRPMLISGPLLSFVLNSDVSNNICDRYFTNCSDTTFNFIDDRVSSKDEEKKPILIPRKVYVINENFTSVLFISASKRLNSTANNGRLLFGLGDYFLGDVLNPELSRVFPVQGEGLAIPPEDKTGFYAQMSLPFNLSFPTMFQFEDGEIDFVPRSCFLRYNSDSSITFLVSGYYIPEEEYIDQYGKRNYVKVLLKSYPNINLQGRDRVLQKNSATPFLEFFDPTLPSESSIIAMHSVEKDSIDVLYIEKTGTSQSGKIFTYTAKKFIGKRFDPDDVT
jgi:hypothetical protein